ncbi:MAG TPA: LysR family transcriptional regulator [Polyangia bacterium]
MWQHIVAMTATDGLDLNQVSVFVRVMETGSFTAAARTLGLPKSSVSRRVSALEKSLGVRLLQRGTRKLVLTEAGRLYFERARAALAGLADVNAAVTDMSREIGGPIRFTAGADNTGLIANLISEFLQRYPKVQLDVVLTPRRVDLVAEGFDLALRAGPLIDSSLVVRRVGRSDHALFASRAYLRKAGKPQRVSDLTHHRFVLFGEPHERENLRLTGPDGAETVKIRGPLVVHDMSFAADAIAAGVGIGLVPEAYFGWAKMGGSRSRPDLVRVLPDHRAPGAEVSLVSPPTAYEPARVGLLRDFLAERLRPLMQACAAAAEEQRTSRRLTPPRRDRQPGANRRSQPAP